MQGKRKEGSGKEVQGKKPPKETKYVHHDTCRGIHKLFDSHNLDQNNVSIRLPCLIRLLTTFTTTTTTICAKGTRMGEHELAGKKISLQLAGVQN